MQACSLTNEELNKILEPFLAPSNQLVHKRTNTVPVNTSNEKAKPMAEDEPTDEQIMQIELQILKQSVKIPYLAPL